MLVGAITVIVWKQFALLGLYEIIPGFLFASLAIWLVSLKGAPTRAMLERFELAERAYRSER
jgi:sodium/proline symporter